MLDQLNVTRWTQAAGMGFTGFALLSTSEHMIQVRRLQASDIQQVLRVQSECYRPELIESEASFEGKLTLYPRACVGAWDGRVLRGYLFAHPWIVGEPVHLDTWSQSLPPNSDGMYLHDLSISPSYRGKGIPKRLLDVVIDCAREVGLMRFALVAVQQSEPFWERWGFSVKYTLPYAPGVDGSYMTCEGIPVWR